MRILPLIIAVPLIGIATTARSAATDAAPAQAPSASVRPAPAAETSVPRAEPGEDSIVPAAQASVGGPLDESPIGALERLVEEDEDARRWLGGPDPMLERRYAPTERQPLNSLTIRFWQ